MTTDKPFLKILDTPIYFEEDWDQGIGGGLWSTGLAIALYLQQHPQHARTNLIGCCSKRRARSNASMSMLELGSGNGLLSICFFALARDLLSDFVITDVASHLPLMQRTLDANSHLSSSKDDDDKSAKIHLLEHNWGNFEEEHMKEPFSIEEGVRSGRQKFDLIVGSDVAYRDELHDPLISSLLRFSHDDTISLIGVTMSDTKPVFFHKLRDAGFQYERMADHLMEERFRGTTFGIFMIRKR